jgi:hypothetical protein
LADFGGATREGKSSTLKSNTNDSSSRCDSNRHRHLTNAAAPITAR